MPEKPRPLRAAMDELLTLQRLALLDSDRVLRFQYHDQSVRLQLPDAHVDLIQKEILRTGQFFEGGLLEKIQPLIRSGGVILDAGANIGNHTVFFSKFCQAQQVLSFEPQHNQFEVLLKNIQINSLSGVQAFNAGLGEAQARASIARFKHGNSGATAFDPDADGAYTLLPLDSLQLPRLDFAKIDVEGRHLALLRGAKETLRRLKPLIVIELREAFDEVADGVRALREMGYREPEKVSRFDWLFRFA